MKTVIIIPARFKSSRFPGKPLTLILGKPMILWVAEICAKALPIEFVYIATDDLRIKEVVEEAGFNDVEVVLHQDYFARSDNASTRDVARHFNAESITIRGNR